MITSTSWNIVRVITKRHLTRSHDDLGGSGDAVIGQILVMKILMQIVADFKWILWNIDAGGRVVLLLGEYLLYKYWCKLRTNIMKCRCKGVRWCIFWANIVEYLQRSQVIHIPIEYCGISIQGVWWCCYWANINDENLDADWCIFQAKTVKYWCIEVGWCRF